MSEKKKQKTKEPKPPVKKEMVQITREDLDSLISGYKGMRDELDVVKGTISKQRLKESEESLSRDESPRGFLRIVRGKIVQGWKGATESEAVANNGVKDLGNGSFMEVMKMHAILLDKDAKGNPLELICDYSEHSTTTQLAHFRVVGTSQKDGETFFTCRFEDEALDEKYGEVTINIKFIN